jgi:hypothetical protein
LPFVIGFSVEDAAPISERKPRRWPKRLLKAFLWTGGSLVLLWVCTYFYASWELGRAIEEVRKRGEPTNETEALARIREKSGDTTGAEFIRRAIEEDSWNGAPSTGLSQNLALFQSPIPSEELPAIEAQFAKAAAVFPLIDQAISLPPGLLTASGGTELDHETVQQTRRLSRLLWAEVRFAAATGDKRRAFGGLKSLYLLPEQLAADQFVITQLVRVALMGMTMTPTQASLESLDFTPEELDELCLLLGRIEANYKVAEAMKNHRAVVAQGFQSRDSIRRSSSGDIPITPTKPLSFGERLWWNTQKGWGELVASPLGLPARLRASAIALRVPIEVCELIDRPAPWTKEEASLFEIHEHSFDLSQLSLTRSRSTPFSLLYYAALRARQRLDLTRIMLRVQRYYVVNGKLPEKLDEVCGGPLPNVPTKWFEGKQPDYVVEKGEVFLSGSAARVQVKMWLVKK